MQKQQLQIQKQVSKKDYRLFLETIAQLEKYIEVAGYYRDWKSRKWIHDNTIKRKDVFGGSEKTEELVSTQLFILSKNLEDMPSSFREELKEDFYRWIDTTGINVNNCPSKLKHFLFKFNEVLEGHSERNSSSLEHKKKIFNSIQTPMQGEKEIQWSLDSKFFYKDLELKNKLIADAEPEQGKKAFEQIAENVAWRDNHGKFHSFKHKKVINHLVVLDQYQIIQDVKTNPQNWRLDEIPTEIDEFGRTKKQEWLLVYRGARENSFDQIGKLNFTNNPLYRWESFSAQQRFEIKKTLNISVDYITKEEIKWIFKEDPRYWKVGKIQGQTYLIHNSARIKKEEIGTLIHSQQKFSKEEWMKIDEALKNCFSTKKKSNSVSFVNKDYNIKDQDSKEDEEEKKWLGCKATSCDNDPNYWSDYCSYHQKCLDKLREYESSINSIRELETFETWFNGNCGYVINYDYSISSEYPFYIWVVVYETKVEKMSEILKTFAINSGYDKSSLESAKSRARTLRNELNGENPILAIHPNYNSYVSFSDIIKEPYVIKRDLPQIWEEYNGTYWFSEPVPLDVKVPANNISDYAKIFDVLKVSAANYWHVGVYIGNGKVCHFSKERNGTYIDSWEDFKKIDISLFIEDNSKAFIYHPIIPFKNYKKIVQQIAWSVENNFRRNNYNLADRNCEHLANMLVYGINYSEQVENSSLIGLKYSNKNNGKGSRINLSNEMTESNNKLGITTNNLSEEIEERYLQEIPANNCQIM